MLFRFSESRSGRRKRRELKRRRGARRRRASNGSTAGGGISRRIGASPRLERGGTAIRTIPPCPRFAPSRGRARGAAECRSPLCSALCLPSAPFSVLFPVLSSDTRHPLRVQICSAFSDPAMPKPTHFDFPPVRSVFYDSVCPTAVRNGCAHTPSARDVFYGPLPPTGNIHSAVRSPPRRVTLTLFQKYKVRINEKT